MLSSSSSSSKTGNASTAASFSKRDVAAVAGRLSGVEEEEEDNGVVGVPDVEAIAMAVGEKSRDVDFGEKKIRAGNSERYLWWATSL